MEILHLSGGESSRYIQILPQIPPSRIPRQTKRLYPTPQPRVSRYEATAPVILDYVSGMSVLAIYEGEQAHLFYLDRVVLLQPGTRFSLLPMAGDCCVELLAEDSEPAVIDTVPTAQLQGDTKGLGFQRIYTLLYQEFPHNFYFRGEAHQPYELVYVQQGTLHNLVQGKDIVLPAGHFLIIDSNHWHTQYSESAVSFLTLSFWAEDPSLSHIAGHSFPLTPKTADVFQQLLTLNRQSPYAHDCAEGLLKILLARLLEKNDPQTRPSPIHWENQIVDQAVRIISEHATQKLTLEDLAARVHVSVPYLYKLFQIHLGTSPGKYIAKIRTEECKVLLRDNRLSIGEIAEEMGFSSPQHFSRMFKNTCGITPSEYKSSLI